jgi:molybdopterin-guanine dinucleotide biosynthesis protein A
VHHLIALWPVEARIPLRDLLSCPGPRNVEKFSETIGVRRVDFPLATWDPFLNVNTPADLKVARSLADHLRTEGCA